MPFSVFSLSRLFDSATIDQKKILDPKSHHHQTQWHHHFHLLQLQRSCLPQWLLFLQQQKERYTEIGPHQLPRCGYCFLLPPTKHHLVLSVSLLSLDSSTNILTLPKGVSTPTVARVPAPSAVQKMKSSRSVSLGVHLLSWSSTAEV